MALLQKLIQLIEVGFVYPGEGATDSKTAALFEKFCNFQLSLDEKVKQMLIQQLESVFIPSLTTEEKEMILQAELPEEEEDEEVIFY